MIHRAKVRAAEKTIKDRLESACNTLYDPHIDIGAALADFQLLTVTAAQTPRSPAKRRYWRPALATAACTLAVLGIGIGMTVMLGHLPPAPGRVAGTGPQASAGPSTAARVSHPPGVGSPTSALPDTGQPISPLHSGSSVGATSHVPTASPVIWGAVTGGTEVASWDPPCFLSAGVRALVMAPLSSGCGMGVQEADAGPSAYAQADGMPAASPAAASAAAIQSSSATASATVTGSPTPSPTESPTPSSTAP